MSDTEPTISVVIPVYNAIDTLERCITSIVQSSIPNGDIQIVVVDDGSSDESFTLAKSLVENNFHSSSTVIRIDNSGACVARNFGQQLTKAFWIVFLDADDFYVTDFILFVARQEKSEYVIAGNYQLFNGIATSEFKLPKSLDVKERIARGSFSVPGAFALPRTIAERFTWSKNLVADQDGEWIGRIVFSGVSIRYFPEFGVVYSTENHNSLSKKRTLESLRSRVDSVESILNLIEANPEYHQYKPAIAQRMDLIAFSYYASFPEESRAIRKRAELISVGYKHAISGKKGLLRNLFGFYGAQMIIKIFER
jgi:glycosyltransferase involved in cell wall biosynthesis